MFMEVLHTHIPFHFALLVATIAAFCLFFTINARLRYLLSMTGNVLIVVILYLRYSVDITFFVTIAVTV